MKLVDISIFPGSYPVNIMVTLKLLVRRAQTRGIPSGDHPRSIAELATKAGISRQYLHRLMSGEAISPELRPKLAKALGVAEVTLRRAKTPPKRKPRRASKAKARKVGKATKPVAKKPVEAK